MKIKSLKDQKFVFGSVQIVANIINTLLERELKEYDITFKQWFLTIVVENRFDEAPTIKEVSKAMGTSHQNVKQIALRLEKKGLIELTKDKNDARVTRIALTEKNYQLSDKLQNKAAIFTKALFNGIDEDDMAKARTVLDIMMSNLTDMDQIEK